MDKISQARSELRHMEELARGNSPVHRMHPLSKLLITVVFIAVTVSFDKYDFEGLIVMVLFPVIAYQAAEIPLSLCFRRLRYVLPLVCAMGIVNPFLDRQILLQPGGLPISGGMISMLTLMLKGVLALTASFLLIATTSMDSICAALRQLHVPAVFPTLMLLTYRYLGVMMSEAGHMMDAYRLRAPGQNGVQLSAWGSFLGQLLLRSIDRAEELWSSMQLRGFRGEFYYAEPAGARPSDYAITAVLLAAFFLARFVGITRLLGGMLL